MPQKNIPFISKAPSGLIGWRTSIKSCTRSDVFLTELDVKRKLISSFSWSSHVTVTFCSLKTKIYIHIQPHKCSVRTFSKLYTLLWKQCISRSAGFIWSQLIRIYTVFHPHKEYISLMKLHLWTWWKSENWCVLTIFIIAYMQWLPSGPRSAVGNVSGYRCVSDCGSRGREFDPGPVPYFRGDWSWNNFYGHSPPFRWFIQEGLLSVTSESMRTNYWLTACSSLPRKKCG